MIQPIISDYMENELSSYFISFFFKKKMNNGVTDIYVLVSDIGTCVFIFKNCEYTQY